MTLEGLGTPLWRQNRIRERCGRHRYPAGRWGPEWPSPEPAGWGAAGAPLLGSLALGLGARRVGTRRGQRGLGPRQEGGAFLCQGICAARPRLTRVSLPAPSPSRGAGLSLRPGGARWVWACELSGRRWAPSPGAAQKPLLRCLGFQSPPPPLPSRSGSSPSRLRPCPPPLAVRVALPGVQGGCPGGAARGRGGEPSASRALPASGGRAGRAARGRRARPRSAREEPFVPSQKFACRDRDSCGRGGRRGRRRRRIEAAA